jgi:hypothetical protein
MSLQDATQPLRITVPVVINREHRTVFEFKTDASTGCHGAFS